MTTCAVPLYDSRDTFVGVVGFDLLLDTIQQDLLKLDVGQAGYAFLVNNQGKVLVRPDMHIARRANGKVDDPAAEPLDVMSRILPLPI